MENKEKRLIDMNQKELELIFSKYLTPQEKVKQRCDIQQELVQRIEVAKMFGISLPTLHKWNKHNVLPKPIKLGGVIYYRRSELEKLINSNQNKLI